MKQVVGPRVWVKVQSLIRSCLMWFLIITRVKGSPWSVLCPLS